MPLTFASVILMTGCAVSSEKPATWWPQQTAPRAVVRTIPHEQFEPSILLNGQTVKGDFSPTHIMVQSVAGLVSRAVNEGRSDEIVWLTVGHPTQEINPDYALYYKKLVGTLNLEDRGQFGSWEIVKRYQQKGILKGYVLYRYDTTERTPYEPHQNTAKADQSVNIATMAAAMLEGVLIEEGQQAQAEAIGLKLLYDARGKTLAEAFNKWKDRLSRNFYANLDPKVAHCRDFAIANKCVTYMGMEEPVPTIMQWLHPLSPIIGWTWEDEKTSTRFVSEFGHFHTATNWSLNMMALTAVPFKPVAAPTLPKADPVKTPHAAAFVMSDGDNICWFTGDFVKSEYYWGSPAQQEFAFNWTTCLANLSQVSPLTARAILESRPAHSSLIEYAGGYLYPDVFAVKRPDRRALLAEHARRTWSRMQATGQRILAFICIDIDSPAAQEAYQVFAEEMPGLLGMMAVQYFPYEGGLGKTYWFRDKQGNEIPVVSAKYSIWANARTPHSGTPAKIARLINEHTAQAEKEGKRHYCWTIVHAWSGFKNTEDEDAQNGRFLQPGNDWGVGPVKWCSDRLDPSIKTVSAEELMALIRADRRM